MIGRSSSTCQPTAFSESRTAPTVSQPSPPSIGAWSRSRRAMPSKWPDSSIDREPLPAVAEEVLVERLADRRLRRDRDRLGVHDVGDRHALDPLVDGRLHQRAARRLVEQERDRDRSHRPPKL